MDASGVGLRAGLLHVKDRMTFPKRHNTGQYNTETPAIYKQEPEQHRGPLQLQRNRSTSYPVQFTEILPLLLCQTSIRDDMQLVSKFKKDVNKLC